MGQSASAAAIPSRRGENNHSRRFKCKATALISPMLVDSDDSGEVIDSSTDYISDLPDECLASIFQSLGSGDRNRCSLVCRRWMTVEGQSRHRLSLHAHADLQQMIPSLFSRFDAVTKIALKCERKADGIGDEALTLISLRCRNLTRLKLRACRELTDAGMLAFAKNCKGLKKLSCGSCGFGAKAMNAVLDNCPALEELSVKRLHGLRTNPSDVGPIGPGVAGSSLKTICLKEVYNGQCFGPLLIGAKKLRTVKLFRCSGDWDKLFQVIAERVTCMVEIHLEKVQVSDIALAAISNCLDLEILHLVKTPDCTNVGLISVSERCKRLRKLHIDGWKSNRVGDEGLISVAKSCPNLQELVLIGVNPTKASLETLAVNCPNLERLALCGSDTVGDPELLCIAAKCGALKKLCIKSCPVSDLGLEGLVSGCPKMVKVKVKKCRLVTPEGADSLRAKRPTLAVTLDTGEPPQDAASASDIGAQDNPAPVELLPLAAQPAFPDIASSSTGRSASFKSRLSLLSGKTLVACTLRRWVSRNS